LLKVSDQIEIIIDRLATGGRGVGRHEGMVVFIPDTAPNETVRAQITSLKKNFAEAKLVEILKPSPSRVKPICPVAGICGGCSWQHIAYDEQLRQKQNIVADAMRKFAGRGALTVEPTVPSPNPFSYRNRIQLHYENGQIGFHKRGSNEIVPIDVCAITDDKLIPEIKKLRGELSSKKSPAARRELYLTEQGVPSVSSELRFDDELGFAQVNESQNQNLIRYVLENLDDPEQVFDLYAGAGNFALAIASARPELKRIIGVELHPKSVEHGKKKAQLIKLNKLEFVHASVGDFLTEVVTKPRAKISKEDFSRATVVLDPPRAGCDDVVRKRLIQLMPQTIVYVSCDPVTLARDLAAFNRELYDITRIQPFDMFPQTDHVETIVVLKRRN
jgi:23S rRNA (uracil1939-C5)-methyltransferase